MTAYEDFIERKTREYGDRFDPSDLDQRFIPFFRTGDRVKVQSIYEERFEFGTVGVTTGWKPAFLLVHRWTDHGSTTILDSSYVLVAVKPHGAFRYRVV